MEQLAVGRAAGMTVREWCRRHGVAMGTAHGWLRSPGFAEKVRAHRFALVRQGSRSSPSGPPPG